MNSLADFLAWSAPGAFGTAIIASTALGVTCGLLGSFVVLRRESLFGDAISHAVFPGVVLGFFASADRNPLVILSCALAAGLLGAFVVDLMRTTTRLKQDASLGIVLSVFFALGIGLYTMRQGGGAGVQSFFYGQTAAIDSRDLWMMVLGAVIVTAAVIVFHRPLLVASFDAGYARNLGYPVGWLNRLFAGLLAMTVVVALQAVGVILVSAMLITPAATANLLTDRFERMLGLAVVFGVAAGVGGSLVSSQVTGLSAGPVIALFAAAVFGGVYVLAPQYGVLGRWLRSARQRARIRRENSLKDLYRLLERAQFPRDGIAPARYVEERRLPAAEAEHELRRLERRGELIRGPGDGSLQLSAQGMEHAARVVRNHRLWELYLTNEAMYPADHVHDDAEIVEHLLGDDAIRRLEAELGYPETDPHGSPIPALAGATERKGD
ncbi:MAG: iron chelate uptake ABC transporter family permease subunit [Akkermansiaceae bacterium]|nr:iron chelate uptake ABC transporter family permease subunit [Akkermansiaceae bacterium]NNM29154.1 iron chelate uptake ABC transporter family permease subunit [Akkermansiaceae bacterium]